MHPSLTEVTDPMTRFVVECSFEAFADAGLHPRELEGSRTAVFTCGSYSESEKVIFYEKMKVYLRCTLLYRNISISVVSLTIKEVESLRKTKNFLVVNLFALLTLEEKPNSALGNNFARQLKCQSMPKIFHSSNFRYKVKYSNC